MKKKFTILGCGSSLGSPWITNYWGNCNKKTKKNIRTRCSAHFQYKDISILIDTSPDIKIQFKNNKIDNIDAVIYTHEHADQTFGIFELRPFFWKYKKKINIYCSKKTNKKNLRTRCCAHFQYKNISTLIDTSPDLKTQFLKNNITDVDAVIYTHEHADQTSGIFELRPFFWKNKKKIDVYGSKKTIKDLKIKYDFCFNPKN